MNLGCGRRTLGLATVVIRILIVGFIGHFTGLFEELCFGLFLFLVMTGIISTSFNLMLIVPLFSVKYIEFCG